VTGLHSSEVFRHGLAVHLTTVQGSLQLAHLGSIRYLLNALAPTFAATRHVPVSSFFGVSKGKTRSAIFPSNLITETNLSGPSYFQPSSLLPSPGNSIFTYYKSEIL